MEIAALQRTLERLDSESYQLIHALYLANTRKTLRQPSLDSDISVMTLQDRKKKILPLFRRNMRRKNFQNIFPYKPPKVSNRKRECKSPYRSSLKNTASDGHIRQLEYVP